MVFLIINSGSSSIKFQVFDTKQVDPLCKGLIERIGGVTGSYHYSTSKNSRDEKRSFKDHLEGIELVLSLITDQSEGVISSLKDIDAVSHRVVHGGESIQKAELVTPEIEKIIEANTKLAPLHNPAALIGIRACAKLLPGVPMTVVFDTAFHTTMPEEAFLYGIPFSYHKEHHIRRFGFHGASHKYVSIRAAEILGKKPEDTNIVTCHLGNGVSLTAIKGGKSVDTSLGFGTMCGAPMGTRAGDIDPAVMLYFQDNLNMSPAEVSDLIYKDSGLKGMSGLTNDLRDLLEAADKGNHDAELAIGVFVQGIRKFIGSLATNLGGRMDALIFTAGIGENAIEIRRRVCEGLEVLGIQLDEEKNNVRGKETVLSKDESKVKVLLIPTNEELMMAKETEEIIKTIQ